MGRTTNPDLLKALKMVARGMDEHNRSTQGVGDVQPAHDVGQCAARIQRGPQALRPLRP